MARRAATFQAPILLAATCRRHRHDHGSVLLMGVRTVYMCSAKMHTAPTDKQSVKSRAKKILEPFLDLCVSSLREGHANLVVVSFVTGEQWIVVKAVASV